MDVRGSVSLVGSSLVDFQSLSRPLSYVGEEDVKIVNMEDLTGSSLVVMKDELENN